MTPAQPNNPPAATAELPFDPLRLLGGLVARWRWLVIGAVLGAVLGLGVSLLRSSTRYEVNLRLMRREIPASFRGGEIGEAYKPRQINNATLISAALSDNVLSRVAAKAVPRVSVGLLRLSLDAKEQRGTEFVLLTVSGYNNREATVNLANLWGQEVVEFSRELQTRESREIRTYLQQQLELTDADLNKINQQVLDISRREGIINAEKQIDASLRSLGDLDLRYETARIDLLTLDFRIQNLEAELGRLNPAREKLQAAQRDLDEALVRYTDKNPLVLELRARVETLKREAATADNSPADLSLATSTVLGNALYLQLVELRSQKQATTEQLAQLTKLREKARTDLDAIPEKAAQLSRLLQTRGSLETARNLLFARLREAQLFEERAPGYFQLFSPAAADAVSIRPKWLKLLAYLGVGLLLGTALAGAAGVGAELLDSRLRTAAEARRLFKAPVWARVPPGAEAPRWLAAVESLWMQLMARTSESDGPSAVWAPLPSAAEEQFWEAMITEGERLLDGLLIVDAGAEPSPRLARLPAAALGATLHGVHVHRIEAANFSLSDMEQLADRLRAADSPPVCCRFAGPPREPANTLARRCRPPLVLIDADIGRLDFWEEQARIHRTGVKAPAGLLVSGESPRYHRG
jgi:uncharacterized protein involved in exopolysaccharide biosynthesis